MRYQWVWCVVVVALGMSACGESEESSTTDAGADAGSDAVSDSDSASDGDSSEVEEVCVPDELAAALVGVNTAVSTESVTVVEEAGVSSATVDASAGGSAAAAERSFVYVDLDAGGKVDVGDANALSDSTWDVAFKRTQIRVNSADSGPGVWMLTRVTETSFAEATPPGQDAAWLTDDFVTDDCEVLTIGRGEISTAFGVWYNYDPSTHSVSVVPGDVYFLYNRVTHGVFKFEITSYDDGVYEFRWAPLS